MTTPPVCDYEGSDYQSTFWDQGDRAYEDLAEAAALRRLLPPSGRCLLELGAGAGRNTLRYANFERIVLLDYSHSQLQRAQDRLGRSARYMYVAADIYRLPFAPEQFDAATMIRTLHHMADGLQALRQVRETLRADALFILEFANKHNLKAMLRYLLGRQAWSPFSLEPVEFAALNFDFHPKAVRGWLTDSRFRIEHQLTVSHFRSGLFKRLFSPQTLAALDAALQPTGAWWQLSPSVFIRARAVGPAAHSPAERIVFRCPECGHFPLNEAQDDLSCASCARRWTRRDGIYDFKQPAD